ncbi:MAG TPA: hypothetical protein VK929_00500 [Longimicrobiales bacterium]|nr:hypothetical protein [Longimicrobiales bacterium]
MRLGLGSGADPHATVAELAESCARRGLLALEVSTSDVTAFDSLGHVDDADLGEGVRLTSILADEAHTALATVVARRLAVPLVLDRGHDNEAAVAAASVAMAAGVTALPLMHGPADGWLPLLPATVPFAWQVDDSVMDPASDAERISRHNGGPVCIRLVGGGPETALQDGRGIGATLRVLALAGYAGPLIVTPSSHRYRVAWAGWLGRRGGWGCGSSGDRAASAPLTLTGTGQ